MKYIFTETQFMTLLALSGQRELYLFDRDADVDDVEIVQSVVELYQMGCVKEQQGSLVLEDAYRDIVAVMAETEYVVEINQTAGNLCQQLLYPGKKGRLAVLEKKRTSGAAIIKIQDTDMDYYIYDLLQNAGLPECFAADRREAERLEEQAMKAGDMETDFQDTSAETCLLSIRRIEKARKGMAASIRMLRGSIFTWLDVDGENGSCRHLYSEEELTELLLKILRGEAL